MEKKVKKVTLNEFKEILLKMITEEYESLNNLPNDENWNNAIDYFLDNNIEGVSKGSLMRLAYENTNNVDSAIPRELWDKVDNRVFYVYDYTGENRQGELVDLREKLRTSKVPTTLSVLGNEEYDLDGTEMGSPYEAIMYVYKNQLHNFEIAKREPQVNNVVENKRISLSQIYKKIIKEAEEDNMESKIVYDSPVYSELENSILTLAQISNFLPGFSADDASKRSLFNKKAKRQTIDGHRYGFTQNELDKIETALKSVGD